MRVYVESYNKFSDVVSAYEKATKKGIKETIDELERLGCKDSSKRVNLCVGAFFSRNLPLIRLASGALSLHKELGEWLVTAPSMATLNASRSLARKVRVLTKDAGSTDDCMTAGFLGVCCGLLGQSCEYTLDFNEGARVQPTDQPWISALEQSDYHPSRFVSDKKTSEEDGTGKNCFNWLFRPCLAFALRQDPKLSAEVVHWRLLSRLYNLPFYLPENEMSEIPLPDDTFTGDGATVAQLSAVAGKKESYIVHSSDTVPFLFMSGFKSTTLGKLKKRGKKKRGALVIYPPYPTEDATDDDKSEDDTRDVILVYHSVHPKTQTTGGARALEDNFAAAVALASRGIFLRGWPLTLNVLETAEPISCLVGGRAIPWRYVAWDQMVQAAEVLRVDDSTLYVVSYASLDTATGNYYAADDPSSGGLRPIRVSATPVDVSKVSDDVRLPLGVLPFGVNKFSKWYEKLITTYGCEPSVIKLNINSPIKPAKENQ